MRTPRVSGLFGDGLVAWILDSDEPAARFVARTRILHEPQGSPEASAARRASIATRLVRELVATVPGWGTEAFDRLDSVRYLPNALVVLHDLGVRAGDFPGVDAAVESLLAHCDRHGRFVSARAADGAHATDARNLCESHAATEIALRFGLCDDPRVEHALEQMLVDMRRSDLGRAWCCDTQRGRPRLFSSRECEMCPHAAVLALRALGMLPASERPALGEEAVRSLLAAWRRRAEMRPSGFGHGYQFVTVRWPHLWYDALGVLEAVIPFSNVWSAHADDPTSRQAIVELAAAFIDANTDSSGRVMPMRVAPGFRDLSMGRKGEPSPLASALVRAAIDPLAELADEIAYAQVVEPCARTSGPAPGRDRLACAVLRQLPAFLLQSVVARQLQRQHIGTPWVQTTPETLVADVVALPVLEPRAPYIAAADRLGMRAVKQTEEALYQRRTLVLFRCMRGLLHVVRSDALPVLAAATGRAVRHHSARFLGSRGVSARHYEMVAEQVLEVLAEGSLSVSAIRERLHPPVDLSAVLTHMCTEGLLLRDLPEDGPFGRRTRYARFDRALPDVRLDALDEDAAARELVREYVRAYAPVTEADVVWWTGLGPRRAARALQDLGDELVRIDIEGFEQRAFIHLADMDELESAAITGRPVVALLPAGDGLLTSRRQRSLFVPDHVRPFVFDTHGRPAPTILVDGIVRGVWELTTDGTILLHATLALDGRERRSVEARAEALARALGADGTVLWTSDAWEIQDASLHVLTHPLSMRGSAIP